MMRITLEMSRQIPNDTPYTAHDSHKSLSQSLLIQWMFEIST